MFYFLLITAIVLVTGSSSSRRTVSAPDGPSLVAVPPLPPHPRLLLTPAHATAITALLSSNAQAASYFRNLSAQGDAQLSLPPAPRPADGGNVLGAARLALVRIYIFGSLWRLTRNETLAARGVAELLCFTTTWSDWQPDANALVMGELSHAAAIGLDWLYDFMSPSTRAAVISGLVERGIAPFASKFATGAWWVCASTNWNSVTNSGAGLAALALLGEEGVPPWLGTFLANATQNAKCSTAASPALGTGSGLAPDGSWWESAMYSGYVLRYITPFSVALSSVIGDTSLVKLPGLGDAPFYQVAMMDAQSRYFNTGDCVETQETVSMLLATAGGGEAFALRARLDQNPVSALNTDIANCSSCSMEYINALLFFSARGDVAERDQLPLDVAYPMKKTAIFRESWKTNGTFVGFRGGANCSWFHGDLDAGSFVYTSHGVRWISDLGADNYGLPGYFGGGRYDWYRKNSRGHNTLQFNDSVHDALSCVGSDLSQAPATFLSAFSSTSPSARVFPAPSEHALGACPLTATEAVCAVANMTGAFALQGVASAARTLTLDAASRRVLTIADRWVLAAGAGAQPPKATAALHTFANVTLAGDGLSALLRQGDLAVSVSIGSASPCARSGVTLALNAVRLIPPQDPTEGLTRIDISVDPRTCAGIDVIIAPMQ
jgi:hypothetical protein